jgi:hypothetical protein
VLDSRGLFPSRKCYYVHCLGCSHYSSVCSATDHPHRFGHLLLEAEGPVPASFRTWTLKYFAPATGTQATYRDSKNVPGILVDPTKHEMSLTLSIGEVAKLLRMTAIEDILRDDNIEQICGVFDSGEKPQLVLAGCDTKTDRDL